MTKAEAEQTIRELVDHSGAAPWRMSDADADRLAEAVRTIGQPRVFEIAEEQRRKTGCR